jgi:catechol 2,3-dioxygenase-like lactoylglutathione lyase family enzyme
MAVLAEGNVASRIPAQDLRRARSFYAEKLGLEPVEERPGGLRYRCGNGEFALFESAGAAAGDHTQMAWEVDDLEEAIAELRERGVIFEEYDVPGLETVDGIAQVEGNYPSKGSAGEKAAWFKDSEGNLPACHRSSHDLKYSAACGQPGAFCRATPKTQAETVIRQIPRFTCVMQLIRRRRSVTCGRRHCAAPVGGGHRPARPPGDRWFCPTVGICLPGSGRPRRTL